MGIQLQHATCDNCERILSTTDGPNWALVAGPNGMTTVVYSCPECSKVLGVAVAPQAGGGSGGVSPSGTFT